MYMMNEDVLRNILRCTKKEKPKKLKKKKDKWEYLYFKDICQSISDKNRYETR